MLIFGKYKDKFRKRDGNYNILLGAVIRVKRKIPFLL